MESSDLAITDIFPMRKKRATGLNRPNTPKAQKSKGEKLREIADDPSSKTPGKSIETPPGKQPFKTPTRQQYSNAIGRLRKTPRRIAEWGHEFDNDSGPEITWDNNSPSPTKILQKSRNGIRTGKTAEEIAVLIRKLSKGKDNPPVKKNTSNLLDLWMQRDDDVSCYRNKSPPKRIGSRKRSVTERMKDRENRSQRITRKRRHITSVNGMKFQEELSKFVQNINANAENSSSKEEIEKQSSKDDKNEKFPPLELNAKQPVSEMVEDFLEDDEFFMADHDSELIAISEESLTQEKNAVIGDKSRTDYDNKICGANVNRIVTNNTGIGTSGRENVGNDKIFSTNGRAGVVSGRQVGQYGRGTVTGGKTGGTNRKEAVGSGQIVGTNERESVSNADKFAIRDKTNTTSTKCVTAGNKEIVSNCKIRIPNDELAGPKSDKIVIKGTKSAFCSKRDVSDGKKVGSNDKLSVSPADDCADILDQLDDYDDDILSFDMEEMPVNCNTKASEVKNSKNQNKKVLNCAEIGSFEHVDKGDCEGELELDFDDDDDDDFEIQFNLKTEQKKPESHANSNENGFTAKHNHNRNQPALISDDSLINYDDFDLTDVPDVDMKIPATNENRHVIEPVCDIGDDFPEESFCFDDVTDMPVLGGVNKTSKSADRGSFCQSNQGHHLKTVKTTSESRHCDANEKSSAVNKPVFKKPDSRNEHVCDDLRDRLEPYHACASETKKNKFKFRDTKSLSAQRNHEAVKSAGSYTTKESNFRNVIGQDIDSVKSNCKDADCVEKTDILTKKSGPSDRFLDISMIPKGDSSYTGFSDWDAGDDLFGDDNDIQSSDDSHAQFTSTQKYSNQDIEKKKAEAKRKLQQNLIEQKRQRAVDILQKNRMKTGFK